MEKNGHDDIQPHSSIEYIRTHILVLCNVALIWLLIYYATKFDNMRACKTGHTLSCYNLGTNQVRIHFKARMHVTLTLANSLELP